MMENDDKTMEDKKEPTEEQVKSNSLIKFQTSDSPRNWKTLECSLDLKNPPSNWLNGQIKFTPQMSTSFPNFSSFRLAFDFWRELGDVDVISDSENIKNLLKIPYSENAVLSYFVHRVGNTLLIDSFDLQKYLLLCKNEDWSWLRSFIYDNVLNRLSEKDGKGVFIKHKTREFLEQKNLLSKFLYYSIEDSKKLEEKEYVPMMLTQPLLPQPKREDIPDDHQYSRNVLWTFEDIRMLIGSDMQIFGNKARPCISLRLRDMKKPINVLTGIDYWLDNLMCNVPEIFMCYHLSGIVQKYEVIKTEDLPNLENSQFSPKVIRNVAQNILSFLKSNATKSGHTYWLFKGKNDDFVKLYDLTTLQLLATHKEEENGDTENCEKKEDNIQNPFTVPVAMLLYTCARNMKYSNETLTAKQAGNIKQLLNNCLKLLPKHRYPQIVTSSHYILSDIQIQAGIDPANPSLPFIYSDDPDSDENSDEFEDAQEDSDDDFDLKEGDECYSAVQSIQDTMKEHNGDGHGKSRPDLLTLGNVQERCEESLKHIISGLGCLQFFESEASIAQEKLKEKEMIIHEEQNPKLANPEIAIPMGWGMKVDNAQIGKKLRRKPKREESLKEPEGDDSDFFLDSKSLLMKGAPNVKTWNTHLKVLLFEKASLTYACLAEDSYSMKNYGKTLKNLKMSILCQNLVMKYVAGMATQNCLFGRAGDCYFQISKSLSDVQKFFDGFSDESELDKEILGELEKEDLLKNELPLPIGNEEFMLDASCKCYETSLIDTTTPQESRFELIRRLGNVYNELGVYLMHKAQNLYNAFVDEKGSEQMVEKTYQQIAKKSYDLLMKAVRLFEGVNDSINLVVCNLNLGRFFRLSAHINIFHDYQVAKDIQMQKKMYQKSFDNYHSALSILENRKKNHELWDLVTFELSTATFNLAKQIQDNVWTNGVGGSTDDLERDVLDYLMKALKLCDLDTNSPRQVLYIFRAGLIHHRLGSFYHQNLRSITDDTKKRTIIQLCRLNYDKASNLLGSLKEFKDFFQVQMERIALQEFLAEESNNNQQKFKNYQHAFSFFIGSYEMLKLLSQTKSILDPEEIADLLILFENRLQFILKTLTKLSITQTTKKSDMKGKNDVYKKMFACTLRARQKLELPEQLNHLIAVLGNIKKCV